MRVPTMKSFVALGFAAAVTAFPQASSGSECASTAPSEFAITTVNATTTTTRRSFERRQLDGTLMISLKDGKLTDQAGRTGYIAGNYQFQFDSPVQANAKETEGFGLCSNGSMSLMGSTVFYQCQSGDFYNLYSQSTGAQCIPIHIQATMAGASSSGVSQISDGQPQATSAGPAVSQISDGQPQASKPVVTQISDGQPQASAPAPVVTQISDGQPQASAPVVTQISDGQPQASAPLVTQISDGQPQASAPAGNLTANATMPSMPEYTGAANIGAASIGALAAAFFALFALF
ncbi:covalently-linked cell wall [Pyrenophora seminiperda CCB06]|uniref:Covalently-linked cell wall n=1 Tax=Pyrenophora seminiperda CCB06 TaxID=1302712 RepID=A0A3M7M942_9PLEO|nr:covalently-linked cell wall [Pyrenophora seminiperda CCB06]